MIKNIIFTITIVGSSYCKVNQDLSIQNEEGIIINKVIDIVLDKKVRPKSVYISEQLLSNLDQYLTVQQGEKQQDSLSLLINGQWRYLKEVKAFSYSKDWKQFPISHSPNNKNKREENTVKAEDIRFSTIQFSPDGTRAFVIYNKTSENVTKATVFFFFQKKNGNWIHNAHFIPFLIK